MATGQQPTEADASGSKRPGFGPWFKAIASTGDGCCVEVSIGPTSVRIRDSKWSATAAEGDSVRPQIEVSVSTWNLALGQIEETGTASVAGELQIGPRPDASGFSFIGGCDQVELLFTGPEFLAFRSGVSLGEFAVPVVAAA